MFERDYLLKLFTEFAAAIMRSLHIVQEERDPVSAADMLDTAIGDAVGLDAATFLSLAPESIAQIMQVSGTDPGVTEYVARSLMLSASYRADAGQDDVAALRRAQAQAVADAYGHDISDMQGNPEEPEQDAEKILQLLENRGVNLDESSV